jgi:ABC-type glycerol-3-phosphate transport system permease component
MILAIIFIWNDLIQGVVLAGRSTSNLPVAFYNVLPFSPTDRSMLAAPTRIGSAPIQPLTSAMQKEIVAGSFLHGVKGG